MKLWVLLFSFILIISLVGASTTVNDEYITTTGNVTAGYFFGDGSNLNVNSSTWWSSVSSWLAGWFLNNAGVLEFNETKLNASIESKTHISKLSSGNFIGSLVTTGADSTLSDSNSIFQVVGSDGTPRFQIQNGGSEQASLLARSFIVVNQNNTRLNRSQNNLCSEWGFENIDCNTSTTGADFGVQDDFEAQGLLYFQEGMYGEASDWGVYTFLGDLTEFSGGSDGEFEESTNHFCDFVSNPFTQFHEDNENWVKIRSGEFEGALAEVLVYLNSSCVELNNNPAWNESVSSLSFDIIDRPVFVVSDGGAGKFYVGEGPEAQFAVDILNGTGDYAFEVNSIAGVGQYVGAKFYTDIKTYEGITGIESTVDSSVQTGETNSNNMILQLISSNIDAGLHSFMKAAVVGEKSANLITNLFEVDGDFDTYIKQGAPDNILKVYYDNSNGTTIDVTDAVLNSSDNIVLFEDDNSIVYLGSTTNFTRFSVSLERVSSRNLNFEIYYCNTTGDWPQRLGFTDTTNGFRSSGFIAVEQSSPDRGVCNFDINGVPFSNSTNYTYVALKRTRNSVSTLPIEKVSSISGSSSTFILTEDYIKLDGVSSPPVTCSATYDGAIYYDEDVQFHCSCKSGIGWVQMNDYTTACL